MISSQPPKGGVWQSNYGQPIAGGLPLRDLRRVHEALRINRVVTDTKLIDVPVAEAPQRISIFRWSVFTSVPF